MAAPTLAAAYALLGLAPGASDAEIRRAWRLTARATHPDLHPDDPDAARRFREAEAAHALLSDPARRAAGAGVRASGPDDDWIDGCAWMAEAHLLHLRRDVLPRYAMRYRAGPSLVAALSAAAERGLVDQAPPEAPTRWAVLWAWYAWRGLDLVVEDGPPRGYSPVALYRDGARVRILLWPQGLWAEGVRDDAVLRAVVQRSVEMGLTTAAPVLLGVAATTPGDPDADRWWWAGKLFWPVVWTLVVALSVVMIGSGLGWWSG
ncbi:MAG: J domain-containing protein [Pseudomonadota bacterium]|nr:J domain-containing protein [Pseudomonadota bacterium]